MCRAAQGAGGFLMQYLWICGGRQTGNAVCRACRCAAATKMHKACRYRVWCHCAVMLLHDVVMLVCDNMTSMPINQHPASPSIRVWPSAERGLASSEGSM